MADGTFSGLDAAGDQQAFASQINDDDSHTPHKLEDPTQRAALLTALAVIAGNVDGLEAGLASILAKLSSDPATQATLEAVRVLLAGTLRAAPSADQDPIFDHANGERVAALTSSAVVFTPPAGCKFARFDATVDTFIRTDNVAAADDGDAIRLIAGQPEIIPVTAGVAVLAYAATASVLRVTPLKAR